MDLQAFKLLKTLVESGVGCDIHVIIAKYDKKTGEVAVHFHSGDWLDRTDWETLYGKFPDLISRNYERFAALSNVRGDGPEPNGWPAWAENRFREERYTQDYHSHSCLTIEDAAKIWLATARYGDLTLLAGANPASIFFDLDDTREDIKDFWVLVFYDN